MFSDRKHKEVRLKILPMSAALLQKVGVETRYSVKFYITAMLLFFSILMLFSNSMGTHSSGFVAAGILFLVQ